MGNLNGEILGNLPIPDLSLLQQRAVADFLDRETGRIDALIAKKERLVGLLEEKLTTEISYFVCRGFRDHELADSGVAWLGLVPADWTVCRFNRLISEKVDYRGRTPEKVDSGVLLVTARNVRKGRIDYARSQEFTTEAEWQVIGQRGLPREGDVIMTTEAPLGEVANVDRTDVAFAQRIIKLRGVEGLVDNYYLKYFMMSEPFQHSLRIFSSGSTAEGIKSERMAHLFGLCPPMSEQRAIVELLDSRVVNLDACRRPIEASIHRLRELRSALITAAVTGQIDPETWQQRGNIQRVHDAVEAATEHAGVAS